jgi:type IV secretory pathway TraG/TraD family ATPase VirD4
MVISLLIAVLVLMIVLALIGGWIQPGLQILRSWSVGLQVLHAIVALVLLEIAVNLVIHPVVTVLTVTAGAVLLALLWLTGIAREPMETWWNALRTVRRSQASMLMRLADDDIGAHTRRLMDRRKGYVYLGTRYGRWVCAEPEHAVLVLGPPRQGKTSAIVIPTILAAGGPLVATSTKEDVLLATAPTRAQVGRCWLFDPSGTVTLPASVVPAIQPLRWAPAQACSTWDGAVMIAHNLVATSRPAEGLRDAGHWAERAEALLAPLLHAAALDGLAMRVVMAWVLGHDDETAQGILRRHDAAMASVTLAGVGRSGTTERAGIWSTAAGTLAAYRSHAALAATDAPNFDPVGFVRSSDTVYIAAPGRHQQVTAPLVVALLEEIRSATYARATEHARTAAHQGTRPVLFLLDEVANIAPLPELPNIISEGGGQGLIVLACLQDLSQARDRWGERADGFLSLFGTKLILRGLGDIRTLQAISTLAGEHEVEKVAEQRPGRWSGDASKRSRTYSKQREPRLPVENISTGQERKAVLFRTGRSWTWIRLTPWFDSLPWRSVVAAARRVQADAGRPGGQQSAQGAGALAQPRDGD